MGRGCAHQKAPMAHRLCRSPRSAPKSQQIQWSSRQIRPHPQKQQKQQRQGPLRHRVRLGVRTVGLACARPWRRIPPAHLPQSLCGSRRRSPKARALRARGRPESCEFNTRTGYATHSRIPNQADMSAATPLDPQRIRNGKVTDLGAFGEYLVTNRMSAVRTYVAVYVYIYIYLYIYTYIHISKFGGCKRQDSLS